VRTKKSKKSLVIDDTQLQNFLIELSNNLKIDLDQLKQIFIVSITHIADEWLDYKLSVDKESLKITRLDNNTLVKFNDLPVYLISKISQQLKYRINQIKRSNINDYILNNVNKLVYGVIVRFESNLIIVDVCNFNIVIKKTSILKTDIINVGDKKLFLLTQNDSDRLNLSRSSNEFLIEILKLYIPELNSELPIVNIERVFGVKTCVFIDGYENDINRICLGENGSKMKNIVNELSGEKIVFISTRNSIIKSIISLLKLNMAKTNILVSVDEADKSINIYSYDKKVIFFLKKNRFIKTKLESIFKYTLNFILIEGNDHWQEILYKIFHFVQKTSITIMTKIINNTYQLYSTQPSIFTLNLLLNKEEVKQIFAILLQHIDQSQQAANHLIEKDLSIVDYYFTKKENQ